MMPRISHRINVLLYAFIVSAFFALAPVSANAQPEPCGLVVVKEVRGDTSQGFEFHFDFVSQVFDQILFGGDLYEDFIPFGATATIVETVPAGWRLEDIVCDTEGVVITEIENGITATCVVPGSLGEECIFFNVQTGAIPTLSQWGMIAAAAGLVLVGVWFAVRRRRMQTVL